MNLFEYFASQTKSCLFTHALWPTLSAKSILLWCWPQASMAIASTSHINHHHPRIHWIWAGFEWTRKIKLAGLKMKTEIQATNLTKFSLHVFQMLIPSLQEKFLLNAHVSQTLPKPIISCGFTFAKKNWRNVKNLTLLFKNRIPILPSSSHPFVLPLKKKHTLFTISTLRSPTRFRASEATYIRFKAKLSVKRPATCDTWKDTNMAILGSCHVIFSKIKGLEAAIFGNFETRLPGLQMIADDWKLLWLLSGVSEAPAFAPHWSPLVHQQTGKYQQPQLSGNHLVREIPANTELLDGIDL